jgi:hypothetical protein
MNGLKILLLAIPGIGVSACVGSAKPAPAVGGAQTVMLPPKPANCELELISVRAEDMAPGARFGAGGQYEMVGVVTLGLARGTDVMSPAVKSLVRAKACSYGGEVVSLSSTGDSGHYQISGNSIFTVVQTNAMFTVWGPRVAAAGPQRF